MTRSKPSKTRSSSMQRLRWRLLAEAVTFSIAAASAYATALTYWGPALTSARPAGVGGAAGEGGAGAYRVIVDEPIADAPPELVARLRARPVDDTAPRAAVADTNQ